MVDLQTSWSLARPGVLISETGPALSMLRVLRDDDMVAGRLGKALGLAWPITPNTVAEGPIKVAWMAPGQWALFGSEADLKGPVTKACKGSVHHLADVSAGRRLWRIQGVHARAVIAKGCSIDTYPRVMTTQSCARTLFAQVPILLIASAIGDSFEIVADVSFAGHLQAWFSEATIEYLQ